MAIIHLTAEFKDPQKDWTLTPSRGLLRQFPQATQDIKMGLYGSLYHNASNEEVVDKNSKKKPRCTCPIKQSPHGMTVIKASGRTLKSGMFNGGVIGRHKLNHDHLHRRGDPALVCKDCLDCFFVLDLTGRLTGVNHSDERGAQEPGRRVRDSLESTHPSASARQPVG